MEQIQEFEDSINKQLEYEHSKKLSKFLVKHLPFLNDYHVHYKNNTDSVKDADDLGDILLSGFKDLVHIVKEEGFGIKEYRVGDNEKGKLSDFLCIFEDHFSSYVEFEASEPLLELLKTLEAEGKTETSNYEKLQALQTKITEAQKVFNLVYEVQNLLLKLDQTFLQIILAVVMLEIGELNVKQMSVDTMQVSEDIRRLENKAQRLCEKVLKKAKKYDKKVKKYARV